MFLKKTRERNPKLLEAATELHASGQIRPDTWVIDLDTLLNNAALILREAEKCGVTLYYMTKQFGRNALIASELQKLGYRGAVAVDYKEASVLLNAGLRVAHIGHLVQIPTAEVEKMLLGKPDIVTVYSYEKAVEISNAAQKAGRIQPVMLRVWDDGSPMYPAQNAGFSLYDLKGTLWKLGRLPGTRIAGLTAFPCFLYDENLRNILPTANVELLSRAHGMVADYLPSSLPLQINMPAATCVRTLSDVAAYGGTHAEPGHGLSGTTPLHAVSSQPEIPSMVYVSEVSHHWGRSSVVYGGGLYRRGNLRNALIDGEITVVYPSDPVAVDYYFEVEGCFPIGAPVLMAFRTQMFATRSDVAVVRGIHTGKTEVLGIYDPMGYPLKG